MTDIKVPLNKLNINTYTTEIIVLSTRLYWGYYKHSLLKQLVNNAFKWQGS